MITLLKSDLLKTGGLEKYTWQIARAFCAMKIPVQILTTGVQKSPLEDPFLQIISFPLKRWMSCWNVLDFDLACTNYLTRFPSPIVFGLDRNRFQTHLRAGNGVHAAYLQHRGQEEGLLKKCSFAINPLHKMILSLEKKGFEHPQLRAIFTNSEMVKRQITQFYQTDPNRIHVVHNGVEWNGLKDAFDEWETEKEKWLAHFSLNPLAYQFLFMGHNFRRKGLTKLLQALAYIRKENFQLCIVGKDKNTSYFQGFAKKLQLQDKTFFLGPQSQSVRFYQMADCVVIPSLYDPFANVTVEALAMGNLVLSSRLNGGHEILTSENGLIVKNLDDSKEFAKLLLQALQLPKTAERARQIRQSIAHLDFPNQLQKITQVTIHG